MQTLSLIYCIYKALKEIQKRKQADNITVVVVGDDPLWATYALKNITLVSLNLSYCDKGASYTILYPVIYLLQLDSLREAFLDKDQCKQGEERILFEFILDDV